MEDDLRHLLRCARGEVRDGLGYNGESGEMYRLPTKTFPEAVGEMIERNRAYFAFSADDVEWMMTRATKWQADRDEQKRQSRHHDFAEAVGPRFASATLESYQIGCDEQRKAMDSIQAYIANIKEHVAAGAGAVLFGSAGSGKTHLLVGMGKAAIDAGVNVEWRNGVDLAAEFRGTIGRGNGWEEQLVKELVDAEILILDDVLPVAGVLSEYQASNLYRIVNGRYNQLRPTWSSMNVADGSEAEKGAGCQTVDRLRHNALTLFCGWESYRKAQA
jgi:DNA replication protein DnaC